MSRSARSFRSTHWPGDLLSIDYGAQVEGTGRGPLLQVGLVIAIEPILIESGDKRCRTLPDDWTVATADGSRAAHVERTIAITKQVER